MPEVLPFRGIRYAGARPPALSRLVAPPYDVISAGHREELAARSPHNIVHLILDVERPGDGPQDNRYVRAGRSLQAWLEAGVLREDASPAFYAVEQAFTGPDGRPRVRRQFLAACRLHDYPEREILPHEKTLAAPKADRLELMKAVKANLSPVFGLYEDERGQGHRALENAIAAAPEPLAEADSDDGARHRLWRVDAPGLVEELQQALAGRKILLADGHHRYEAALQYRDHVDAVRPGLPAGAAHRFVLMALCSTADPGLVIYPVHRLVHDLPDFRLEPFLASLGRFFTVHTLQEDLRRPAGRAWAVAKLAEHSGKSTALLLVSAQDGRGRVLTLREDADLAGVPLPSIATLRDLDVTALHSIVLQHLLGLSPRAQELGQNVRFEVDAGAVVSRTLEGESQLGFLLNPTPLWQVQAVAEAGETMPQKSTFFHPKLASGLVLRRLEG